MISKAIQSFKGAIMFWVSVFLLWRLTLERVFCLFIVSDCWRTRLILDPRHSLKLHKDACPEIIQSNCSNQSVCLVLMSEVAMGQDRFDIQIQTLVEAGRFLQSSTHRPTKEKVSRLLAQNSLSFASSCCPSHPSIACFLAHNVFPRSSRQTKARPVVLEYKFTELQRQSTTGLLFAWSKTLEGRGWHQSCVSEKGVIRFPQWDCSLW